MKNVNQFGQNIKDFQNSQGEVYFYMIAIFTNL